MPAYFFFFPLKNPLECSRESPGAPYPTSIILKFFFSCIASIQVHNFAGKGRGVVTTRLFRKGEFVVEYAGDLIDMTEARIRERLYAADQNTGCYMYYFQHKNQSYWFVPSVSSSIIQDQLDSFPSYLKKT